ncbi:unnamed protein product [Euphydryas editha]|uniref:Uncharacterized protein n=1 Tax=Euphydryas editha TaxID=104508 RepID=A0AAU9TMN6_EUPED|nr:unnamed protein product [Euphydryas editha]
MDDQIIRWLHEDHSDEEKAGDVVVPDLENFRPEPVTDSSDDSSSDDSSSEDDVPLSNFASGEKSSRSRTPQRNIVLHPPGPKAAAREITTEREAANEKLSSLDKTEQTQKIDDLTYVASGSSSDSDEVFYEPLTTDDIEVVSQKDIVNQPGKRIRHKPDRYNYSNMCIEDMTSEPKTVYEALDGPEKEHWTKAM